MASDKFAYPKTDEEIQANAWQEITEEQFYYWLECVPPAAQKGGAFAVGEALCHMNDGRVVHRACIEIEDRFYSKPYPLDSFNPQEFAKEIGHQDAKATPMTPQNEHARIVRLFREKLEHLVQNTDIDELLDMMADFLAQSRLDIDDLRVFASKWKPTQEEPTC